MKIEIVSNSDESFKLFGIVGKSEEGYTFIPETPAENVEISEEIFTEEPAPEAPSNQPQGVPFHQPRQSNTFDIFGGTSWGGPMQRPGDIGR